MADTSVVTIERFFLEQEKEHPHATGDLTRLLVDIALAGKVISGYVRRAGLNDILGAAGKDNPSGEEQQKLDVIANDTMVQMLQWTGLVCVMASEEEEDPVSTPVDLDPGKYVLHYDPLDGSSNIDVNVSIGTIFSVHQRVTDSVS